MPKKYGKMESESSTSQSDDEKPRTGEGSRKSRDKKKGPGPKKRLAESPGATSSGIVPPPIHSLKGYTEEVCASPSKKTRPDRNRLVRSDAFDKQGGEDSNQALSLPMRSLGLKGESGEKEPNEPQPPGVSERVTSAAELEQSPKMSHVQSSEVHPTSPKKKGVLGRLKDKGKRAMGFVEKLRSPKHSPDKGSSSEKADLKLKQKPLKGDPLNLNRAKTEASSSSGSPRSKRGYSSLDKSLPSTSSSGPNVEYQRPAKKSPLKSKSGPESSSASTSDSRRRGKTLTVPSGSGGHGSGQSSRSPGRRPRSRSPCICTHRHSDYAKHEVGCPVSAERQRIVNNRNAGITYQIKCQAASSSTALDPNVEYSRATKSPSKSKKTVSPRVSTPDPSQPGTSRLLDVPPSGNSPNRCDEAAKSPNRSSPTKSPNRSSPTKSPNRSSPTKSPSQSSPTRQSRCICSKGKIRRGEHDDDCLFRSPSRRR